MCVSSAGPDWLIESVSQSLDYMLQKILCRRTFFLLFKFIFVLFGASNRRVGALRYPLLLLKCSCRMKG